MSTVRFRVLAAALLASLSLAGCAVAPPPPMTTLDGRICTPAPDFTLSHPLELGARATIMSFDQNTPCWQSAEGKRSAYVLFTLPNGIEPYLLSVTSAPIGQALIAPHLYLLDGLGNKLRDASRDSFAFHGSSLSMNLRAYPNERYLLVASEPDTLGGGGSQLRDGVVVTNYSTGYGGFVSIHTGFEQNQNYVYAVNGTIIVSAEPIPKVN